MKVAIYSRKINVRDVGFLHKLLQSLKGRNIQCIIHQPFLEQLKDLVEVPKSFHSFHSHREIKEKIDFMFSLGGDGTLLDTLAFVRNYNVPVLGINMGRLGFLANVGTEEIEIALDALMAGSYINDSRTMLTLDSNPTLFGDVNYALNEFTIAKKDTNAMLTIHAYMNGEFLNSYWADGLIVATATGSTAYSLSCGGPIMAPSATDFVLTPIAPHNLNVRPIVVPDNSVLTFEIEGRSKNYMSTLDSRYAAIDSSYQLAVRKCEHKFNLVRLSDHNFLRTLATKLNWGSDARK